MKLPRLDIPNYKTKLPVSLTEVTYRPYTVKEEKILLLGMQSQNPKDNLEAMMQVVTNCSSIDAHNSHPVDVEWMFMQIRSCAVASFVGVNYKVQNGDCGIQPDSEAKCPMTISTGFDIGNVEIKNLEEMSKHAKKSGDTWVVMITDSVGIQLRLVSGNNLSDNALYSMVSAIIDGPNVIHKEDFTQAEFAEFIEGFTPLQLEPITSFLESVPYTYVDITAKCKICKKEFKSSVTDIVTFLV